jgi:hypothetical protein
MTTLRSIVTDAYRECGITGVGLEPEADEFDEGLRRLQSIIKSVYGNEMGEPLRSINFGTYSLNNSYAKSEDASSEINSVYIPSNVRLIFNTNTSNTLYLQPNPQDGARIGIVDSQGNFGTSPQTLNGNGRQIEGAQSIVLNTNSLNREWFYRADLGQWVRVTTLLASDSMPLPNEFDDFFITLLAFRLNPRYGAETSQETNEVLKRMSRHLRSRYAQSTEESSEYGLYILTQNPFAKTFSLTSDAFQKGRLI